MNDLRIRPYRPGDASVMKELIMDAAAALEELYPDGSKWLERKFSEANSAQVRCMIAQVDDIIVGFAIETNKGPHRRKLSTVWIDRSLRGRGYGPAVVRALSEAWLSEGLDEVHATGRLRTIEPVARLLLPVGFSFKTIVANRYGPGEHEVVFIWNSETCAASKRMGWVSAELRRLQAHCHDWLRRRT